MSSVSKFIEKKLRLKINQEKSKIAVSKYLKFLGMTIIAGIYLSSFKTASISRKQYPLCTN